MGTVIGVEFVATANFSQLMSQISAANAQLAALSGEQLKLAASSRSAAMSMFSANITAGGAFSTSMVAVEGSVSKFGSALMNNKLKLQDYRRNLGEFYNANTRGASMIENLARQNVRMSKSLVLSAGTSNDGKMMANVITNNGLMAKSVGYEAAVAAERMTVLNKVMMSGSTAIVNWGKNTQWAGRQMMVGLSMPLVIIGSLAAKTFYDFNKELTRFVKVYGNGVSDLSQQAINDMRGQIETISKDLAKAYGIPMKQTAELAGFMAQAGYEGTKLTGALKDVSRLSILGAVDATTAWKTYLSLQTTFNQSTKEMTDNINYFSGVESSTSLSLQDITASIPRVAPAIKALGGNIKDLTGYMVAMREGGVPAAEAANTLKTSLARLVAPTKQTKEVFKGFGIDIQGIVTKHAGHLTEMLLTLQKALDKLDPTQRAIAIQQAFGKQRFANVIALFNNLDRAGSQSAKAFEFANYTAGQRAVLAARELYNVQNTASTKLKRAWGDIQAGLMKFGERFLGVITVVAQGIGKFINLLEKMPSGLKGFLMYGTIAAALVGPIIMLTGVLGNFIGYMIKGLVHIRMFASGSKNNLELITAEMVANNDKGLQAIRMNQRNIDSNALLATSLKQLADELLHIADAEKVVEGRAVAMGTALTTAASSGAGRAAGAAVAASGAGARASVAAASSARTDVALGLAGTRWADEKYSQAMYDKTQQAVRDLAKRETEETVLGRAYMSMTTAQEQYAEVIRESLTLGEGQNADMLMLEQAYNQKISAEETFTDVVNKVSVRTLNMLIQEELASDAKIEATNQATAVEKERSAAVLALLGEEEKAKMDVILSSKESSDATKLAALKTLQYIPDIDKEIISSQDLSAEKIIETLTIRNKIMSTQSLADEEVKEAVDMKMSAKTRIEEINSTIGLTAEQKLVQIALTGELTGEELLIASDADLGSAQRRLAQILTIRGINQPGYGARVLAGGGGAMMGAGMALTAGSMLAHGGAQQFMMTSGMMLMMLPMLRPLIAPIEGVLMKSLAARGIAGAVTAEGGAAGFGGLFAAEGALAGVGTAAAAVVGPLAAVGAAAFLIHKGMSDANKETVSFAEAGDRAVELLDGKMNSLKVHTDGIVTSINSTAKSYERLSNVIDLLPADDPLKKYIKDIQGGEKRGGFFGAWNNMFNISNESNPAVSIPKKMSAIYVEQIQAGVDPKKAKELIDVLLQKAGQQKYKFVVDATIDKININDPKKLSKTAFDTTLDIFTKGMPQMDMTAKVEGLSNNLTAARKNLIDKLNANRDQIVKELGGDNKKFNKMISDIESGKDLNAIPGLSGSNNPWSGGTLFKSLDSGALDAIGNVKSLQQQLNDLGTKSGVLNGDGVKKFSDNIIASLDKLDKTDPTKMVQGIKDMTNEASFQFMYTNNTEAVQKQLVDSIGAAGTAYEPLLTSSASAHDEMNMMLLAVQGIPAALIQAAQDAGTLDAALAAAQSTANAYNKSINASTSSINWGKLGVKHTGSSATSQQQDPYKTQKDANQTRIDQENKIIKAIEKKKAADQSAFEAKKAQNDFLKKQADDQIGYREALASGDFAAAAIAKNEMVNAQQDQRNQLAEDKRQNGYQNQIDTHQDTIDKLNEANKGLDKLSSKAKSSSVAISDTYNDTVSKASKLMDSVLSNSDRQNYASWKDMKNKNSDVVTNLTNLGINVDEFFKTAYKSSTDALTAETNALGITNNDLKTQILKMTITAGEMKDLAVWLKANPFATVDEISAEISIIDQQGKVGIAGITSAPPWRPSPTAASHSGGLIHDNMLSSRGGRSINHPIQSDEVPILAQHGEYMINAKAAKKLGVDRLDMINTGELPKYHTGGPIAGPLSDIKGETSYIDYIYGPSNAALAQAAHLSHLHHSASAHAAHLAHVAATPSAGSSTSAAHAAHLAHVAAMPSTGSANQDSGLSRTGKIKSVSSAIDWLEGQMAAGVTSWDGLCETLARTAYGLGGYFVSAKRHFQAVPSSHIHGKDTAGARRGELGFWNPPNGGYGHVAIADGKGKFYTNYTDGKVAKLPASQIDSWGPTLGVTDPWWSNNNWLDLRTPYVRAHTGGPVDKLQSDEVHRILQAGEYVVQRSAVKRVGVGTLDAINSGQQIANSSQNSYNIVVNPSTGMNENDLAEKVIGKIKLMDRRKGGVRW